MFGMLSPFPAFHLRAFSSLIIMSGSRPTRRRFNARSASQFVKLGRRDAITQLKVELRVLRDQLRGTREDLAVKGASVCQAERALAAKESELGRLTHTLDERSMQEDAQKTEIVALRMQVETLRARLAHAGDATKVAEECRDVGVCALSEKESELARVALAFDKQKTEIMALSTKVEALQAQHAEACQGAKVAEEHRDLLARTLSDKESEVARLTTALDERSALAESQKVDLVSLMSMLDERSALLDSQKLETAALQTQVQTLNERLIEASEKIRVTEERRDIECSELKVATQDLMEERGKFDNFHRHVVELMQQLTDQRTEERVQQQRARKYLEDRFAEQSRLLNESEAELTHLREEIESARKAEDDLRIAVIEIDGRANASIQDLIAEKAQLQATFDRANGERARLAHELADLKRRQARDSPAAEARSEGTNEIAAETHRRAGNGGLPKAANS
jgi:chromosome segregation ATPase